MHIFQDLTMRKRMRFAFFYPVAAWLIISHPAGVVKPCGRFFGREGKGKTSKGGHLLKEAPSLRASLLRELSPTQAPIFADGHQRGLERSLRRGSPVRGRHGFWTCQGIPESGRMPLSCLPAFLNIEKPGIPRKAAVRYWFFLFATPERCFPRCRPPVRCLRIHVYKQWEAAGKVLGGEVWRGRPLSRGAPSKVFPSLISRFRTLCSSVRQWQPSGPFCPPCRQSA